MAIREEVKISLMGMDAFLGTMHASVLLTFEGTLDETVAYLRQRLLKIVQANPVLTGKVVKTGMMAAHVAHFKEAAESDIDDIIEVVDSEELRTITSETQYLELNKCITNHMRQHLSRALRVTVWPGASADVFRVHFSMNHGIGDGASLYGFLNMLSEDEEVVALDPQRHLEFDEEKKFDWWNHKSYPDTTAFARMGGVLYRLVMMKLCPWKCEDRMGCYKVRNEYIAKMKKEHSADGGFVSTNDIITSWWFNRYPEAVARMMTVDVRGRLPGYGADLVGNYFSAMAFDRSEKIDPKVIRRALPERAGKKGPAFTQHSTYRWCTDYQVLVTNWSTFYKTLKVPGAVQRHHLAMTITVAPQPHYNTCIVYKSSDEQTNVLIDLDPTMGKGFRLPDPSEDSVLEAVSH